MQQQRKTRSNGLILHNISPLVLVLTTMLPAGCAERQDRLLLAADREVAGSGLVERLLALAGDDIRPVQLLSGSSGEVLQLGHQGGADLLLVGAPAEVERLTQQGRVAEQRVLMHNEYVFVGRESDPARLAALADGALALRQVNRSGATFAVPARGSAARFKLEQLWKLQTDRRTSPSFFAVEGGVKEAVLAAHAQGTYTLVDRATRLTYLEVKSLKPKVLLQGGAEMANPYQLVLLRPATGREALAGRARALYDTMGSAEAGRLIAGYGVARWGEPLFDAGPPPGGQPVRYDQLPPGSP
ncbi:MAG: hypothetical protein FJ125_02275 [Deltaproteobacteria bacterium]|nr:hypothetical protein [Deltaproteobacteria bacterium]